MYSGTRAHCMCTTTVHTTVYTASTMHYRCTYNPHLDCIIQEYGVGTVWYHGGVLQCVHVMCMCVSDACNTDTPICAHVRIPCNTGLASVCVSGCGTGILSSTGTTVLHGMHTLTLYAVYAHDVIQCG